MSYEYKELIEQAIIDDDRPLDWEEGFKELDRVYAQAAKADEYKAKAVAFDRIKKQYTDCCYTNEVNVFAYIKEGDFRELCEGIFEDYESGEYDA